MNTSNIKSFSVYGLFGTDNVHIPFDENVKILIGENGLGKTQILNLFYYTLTRNFFRLGEFSFSKLILEFHNSKPIEITKESIDNWIKEMYNDPVVKDFIDDRKRFHRNRRELELSESELNSKYRDIFIQIFEEMAKRKNKNYIFDTCTKEIEVGVNGSDILYFPTYRRVEEDLHNLGYNDDELENTLIQFGMDDVQRRFNEVEETIDRYLKEGFSKISSEILSQLVKGFPETDKSFLSKINENDIEIILARVGTQLSDADKSEIRNIVLKQEFKNPSLTYFLQKLVEIYEKQKELDNSVKLFRDTCNKYLVNKKVFYDESAIKIFIKSDRNSSEIGLSKLSSGEKQIISMFAKIYLSESDKRFIVLFDEPELSLSIFWQRELLPDIVKSGKCQFLLAVTHSPFIFENELDRYAIGLNEFIHPIQL